MEESTSLSSEMPYALYLASWLNLKQVEVGKNVISRYRSRVKNYIVSELGMFPVEEIDGDIIEDFVQNLLLKIPKQVHTIRDVYLIVHGSYEKAIQLKLVSENPCKGIEIPRVNQGDIVFWNTEQITQYLIELKHHPQYMVFYLAIHEGLLQGEILPLTWEDVDFKNETIHIRKSLSHDGKEIMNKIDGVNSKIRLIKASTNTISELKKWYKRQSEDNVTNPLNLIVPSSVGTPLNPRNVLRTHKRFCGDLGLPNNSFQDIRHIYILSAIKNGEDPNLITEKVGFSDMRYLKAYDCYLNENEKEKINTLSQRFYKRTIFTKAVDS